MMVTMKTKVAKFIKLARASVGITQQEFSKMIGVQRCSLAKYETAAVMPPAIVVLNVIALCGISAEQLKVINEGR
jgi:transcriptional regulator with XRE-family HTH domain